MAECNIRGTHLVYNNGGVQHRITILDTCFMNLMICYLFKRFANKKSPSGMVGFCFMLNKYCSLGWGTTPPKGPTCLVLLHVGEGYPLIW